jgi:ribosomal protein RSM22 (predicted rRNA methylase)
MSMRDALMHAGAHILAPCPHAAPCPLADDDWCHFAERVSRSRIHRRVKGADLGYEDEKYAYLAVTRSAPTSRAPARVLRRADVHKAAVELTLCTEAGLRASSVRRRDKAGYRVARKLRAGDGWHEPVEAEPPTPET